MGDLVLTYKYLAEDNEDDIARPFSVAPSERTRGNEHKLKNSKCYVNTRKPFYCEDCQTTEYIAQRAQGVSIFGDTQNLTGQSPG